MSPASPVTPPLQAGTVPVRVQVIDEQPRIVDLVLPTYLAVDDLTQRIARDVGLGGWWEDGSRRDFALRARGRVLHPEERLADVGVVPYELLHLLPEPRPGSAAVERPLGVPMPWSAPVSRASKVVRVAALLLWFALLCKVVTVAPGRTVAWMGGYGLSWWAMNAVRGVLAERPQLPRAGIAAGVAVVLAAAPLALGYEQARVYGVTAAVVGEWHARVFVALMLLGLISGWLISVLVWLGPVGEPAGGRQADVAVIAAAAVASCGICGGGVAGDVHAPCPYGCGKSFHRGCVRARLAAADGDACAMCGRALGEA